ncbi:MFS transporter [Actinomadura sp. ATCC 31491]|uniref:MFS transporter n=1 Tax=Actinomadura luzonensis TaxID=2805427 RepID=A0ABT0FQY5_9ACTN|nr:MFS transporter [Actinomadura luzonensis]MCK2214321.1 MFS transporter [Actinomadura luzonensis]
MLALPVVLVAVYLTTLDFFVANLALPSIRAELGAGEAAVQLVIAGYGTAYAAGLIVAGRLGDLYGHRRIFVIGLVLFTAASGLCGLAPGTAALVPARVAQGVAAALLAPQVLVLLGVLRQGAARERAFGWYGTTVGVAGVGGQAIGGLLVAADPMGLGWRACFLVNVPIGIAAAVLAVRVLPRVPATGDRRDLDRAGAALVAGGLVAVVLPLAAGREQGWPWWTWACLGAAAPLLAAFARRQRALAGRGRTPLLDLRVFEASGFAAGLVAVGLLFGTSAGLSFVMALYLQDGLGLGPLAAGCVTTALNAGFFVASFRAHRVPRVAGGLTLVGGLVLLASLAGRDAASAGSAGWGTAAAVAGALAVAGAGMGLLMSPLLASVVPRGRGGAAAGVLGTVQEAGGVIGGTLAGAAFFGALGDGWGDAAASGIGVSVVMALGVLGHCVIRARRRLDDSRESEELAVPAA